MAVYTDVAADELADFLKQYDLGELLSYKGIAEGVENTNFLLHTSKGAFILTLYEKRVAKNDLPFFLALMTHLAEHGVNCPLPVRAKDGEALHELQGRPAAIITFLEGIWPRKPNATHCAGVGEGLARMHLAGTNFAIKRANALSVAGWRPLFDAAADRADEVQPGLRAFLAAELDYLSGGVWPTSCSSSPGRQGQALDRSPPLGIEDSGSGCSDSASRRRRGRPPRNSKCCSFSTSAIEVAPPSQRVRANCRAESHAAEYHAIGRRPGYRAANCGLSRASRRGVIRAHELRVGGASSLSQKHHAV